MSGWRFVTDMAWRESRAAGRRLLLLTATISIGVGALVAINSFTDNLRDSVEHQSRNLMGADLSVSSRSALTPKARALVDTLAGRGGKLSMVTNFEGMAYVPRTAGARLVRVSAIEGGYPFYGEIRTEPAGSWRLLQSGATALVDASFLTALNAHVGDTLALGESRFVIGGAVLSFPGDVAIRAAFGPRVFIPAGYLASTKLLGFGARAEYEAYVQLPANANSAALAARYRKSLSEQHVSLRTVDEEQRNLSSFLDQLGRYLGLVALIALLLGGIGVASAVQVFIRQKRETIAVLRCLGATARQIFAIYLAQAVAMGVFGSVAGVLLGVLLQLALPAVLGDFLPVDVSPVPSFRAAATGLGVGLWVSMVFALLPLLTVRRIPPLAVLRRDFETQGGDWDRARIGALLLLGSSVVGLAALQVGSLQQGAIFAGGIAVALLVLWLAALALIRGLRRWFPRRLPYVWRQGLANLYRPANQTVAVVLALGSGAFLLLALALVQRNLLRDLTIDSSAGHYNLVFFDIQPDQIGGMDSILRSSRLAVSPSVPIVPMRIFSVKGKPVTALLADTGSRSRETPADSTGGRGGARGQGNRGQQRGDGRWALRREFRSTYRDSTVGSEKVVVGDWWKPGAFASDTTGSTAVPISIESGVAGDIGVTIGDTIVWDVQGAHIPSRVVNLREVNWARFEPNFFVVFPDGPLDRAPQSLVLLTRVPDPGERGSVQRKVVERFSNVTSLDLSLVQQAIERIVASVTLAIRFMALFSLATGAVVLIGAVTTTRWQRVREAVLLKTLGATRSQVLRVLLAEYLALGVLSALVAALLATAAGWALMKYTFEIRFTMPWGTLATLTLSLAALTVVVGLLNSREVLRRTPLEVLRSE
ncbi:MAG: FtsX-like permease family protein [Gemmatimonadota bacterium]